MTMARGRHGDSERKRREAYRQHNGPIAGTIKWARSRIARMFGMEDD
jgi:hypothetical protein